MSMCTMWNSYEVPGSCDLVYFEQVRWYDQVMRQDAYVQGLAIFVLDIGCWWAYDIAPQLPYLIPYMQPSQ